MAGEPVERPFDGLLAGPAGAAALGLGGTVRVEPRLVDRRDLGEVANTRRAGQVRQSGRSGRSIPAGGVRGTGRGASGLVAFGLGLRVDVELTPNRAAPEVRPTSQCRDPGRRTSRPAFLQSSDLGDELGNLGGRRPAEGRNRRGLETPGVPGLDCGQWFAEGLEGRCRRRHPERLSDRRAGRRGSRLVEAVRHRAVRREREIREANRAGREIQRASHAGALRARLRSRGRVAWSGGQKRPRRRDRRDADLTDMCPVGGIAGAGPEGPEDRRDGTPVEGQSGVGDDRERQALPQDLARAPAHPDQKAEDQGPEAQESPGAEVGPQQQEERFQIQTVHRITPRSSLSRMTKVILAHAVGSRQ